MTKLVLHSLLPLHCAMDSRDPELYPDLVALNTISSLVGLLGHDNTDIAEEVLEDNDEPGRVQRTKLLRRLMGRIKVRELDANKQYAFEILGDSPPEQHREQEEAGADERGGRHVAGHGHVQVEGSEDVGREEEVLENLFDCLCRLQMLLENKEWFLKSERVWSR